MSFWWVGSQGTDEAIFLDRKRNIFSWVHKEDSDVVGCRHEKFVHGISASKYRNSFTAILETSRHSEENQTYKKFKAPNFKTW